MKIVHIRDAAYVGENLVQILNSMGHQAIQIMPAECPGQNMLVKAKSMLQRIPEAWRIGREVRRGNYDIVHMHVANAGWMATLGRYAYVVHCHGSEIRPGLYEPIRRQLALYTLEHARHVFYVTPDLLQHIMPYRPDATFLPNQVDVERFCPTTERDRSQTVRILLAPPLTSINMPEAAYKAITFLRSRPDLAPIHVAAFGFGKNLGYYQDLLATSEITFLPSPPHQASAGLHNDYDIVVGQFGLGALGMIELESMDCARPVVAENDRTTFGDPFGDLPPSMACQSAQQIADLPCALIHDAPLRTALGQQARAWVLRSITILAQLAPNLSQSTMHGSASTVTPIFSS